MSKALVKHVSSAKVSELPAYWSNEDYKILIDLFGGDAESLSDSELLEYLLMSIESEEINDSALILLQHKLSETLNEGQLQNLSHEIDQDKMWEEYPDMAQHKDIFGINQMLYKGYNGKVPLGECIMLKLEISSKDKDVISKIESQNKEVLLRMILLGSDDNSVLCRLFDEQSKQYLSDAEHIIWNLEVRKLGEGEFSVELLSSSYWFHAYDPGEPYEVMLDMEIYENLTEC